MKTIKEYIDELHKLTNSFNFNSNNSFEGLRYISLISNFIGSPYLKGYTMDLDTKDMVLTRARKNSEKEKLFSNVKELWYPDSKYVKNHGRANFSYKPVYYCSDVPGTSLFEVKPTREGEWISILDIGILKKKLRLFTFGLSEKYTVKGDKNFTNKEIALHEFITDKFREEIPYEKSYLYLPTSIITNLFMPSFDGIIFPSVASKLKGENIALRTQIVDNFHLIKEARTFEIINFKSNSDFEIRCKFVSDKIDKNGDIKWKEVECRGHKIDENIYHKNENDTQQRLKRS